jgi:hypothetical protein
MKILDLSMFDNLSSKDLTAEGPLGKCQAPTLPSVLGVQSLVGQ